jgi:NADH-quinone oxidoreductase subunit C
LGGVSCLESAGRNAVFAEIELDEPFLAGGGTLDFVYSHLTLLELHCGNLVESVYFNDTTASLGVWADPSCLGSLLAFFKFNSSFRVIYVSDLVVADVLSFDDRFIVKYILQSLSPGFSFLINFQVTGFSFISSSQHLFASSGWAERECWDMFGLYFVGQYNLWRLLSDYGFAGFPLRKDFPLTGFLEIFYDARKKKLVRVPVELAQEYRVTFSSFNWLNSVEVVLAEEP